jgi:hypothetical protein
MFIAVCHPIGEDHDHTWTEVGTTEQEAIAAVKRTWEKWDETTYEEAIASQLLSVTVHHEQGIVLTPTEAEVLKLVLQKVRNDLGIMNFNELHDHDRAFDIVLAEDREEAVHDLIAKLEK